MEWGEFFNSELGKSLTNIGTQALTNALNLTGSGKKSNSQVQPVQQVVQTQPSSMLSGNNIYWIAGGGVVLILAIVLIVKR